MRDKLQDELPRVTEASRLKLLLYVYLADVDECETQDCGMEGECTNTIGSFRCDCDAGFEKNDEHVCVGMSYIKFLSIFRVTFSTTQFVIRAAKFIHKIWF